MNRSLYAGVCGIIFLASLMSGCGGSSGSRTPVNPLITATSGGSQSAAIATAFAAPLTATVTSGGSPVSGVVVTFAAPGSGASGSFAGGVNTATTNSNGVATSAIFTANTTLGTYSVTATAPGVTGAASFSLTNIAGAAASIAVSSGSSQSAAINTAFVLPLAVIVKDSGSNPVAGATVTFTAPSSGASGSFAGGATTAITNASGVATSAIFTANSTAGSYNVVASVAGVLGTASFNLTNTALAPASITTTSGSPQSATISTAFAAPLVVTVLDSSSNPVSGAVVTFTAPSSGASVTFAGGSITATTDSLGQATSAAITANATAGSYNVTASVAGVSSVATFSLTNTSGAAASVTATSGTPQSATVNTAFAAPLVATVLDSGSNPVSGVVVTFTAPSSGASGTFAGGVDTATTDVNGVATSAVFTANGTAGTYTVSAAVSGVSGTASFSLTNTAAPSTYAFYVSGLEAINNGPNYYALAGSVTVDVTGHVLTGKQDYNDGFGLTSPQPAGDLITDGTLTINSTTGLGTLVLVTNNASLGVSGTETLAVQFVNQNHALIIQFDGTATSSGTMDTQTVSSTLNDGNYAFTLSGVDSQYFSVVFGGVFTISGGGQNLQGVYDVDDTGVGAANRNIPFTGTVSAADSFGRGTITGTGLAVTLNYYMVGPKAMRLIDVDPSVVGVVSDAGGGSAFSQGSGTFDNTSLGSSVFGIQSSSDGPLFSAAGEFTVPSSGNILGVGDAADIDNAIFSTKAPIAGTYSIAGSGYGNLTIGPGELGEISSLGIYMTDPTLNLTDPNNTASGLGGALVADLDSNLAGTGILLPQTDNTTASFTGAYGFGVQNFNERTNTSSGWELDFVGQGTVSGLAFPAGGSVSDPFFIFTGTPAAGTDPGATLFGSAVSDPMNLGRYTMPMQIYAGVCSFQNFNTVIYQANGGQLFWFDGETNTTFLGMLQQQGSLTGVPAAKRPAKTKRRLRQPNC